MEYLLSIEAVDYVKLFKRVLVDYSRWEVIEIDGKKKSFDWALNYWCNQESINRTLAFAIVKNGHGVIGFHDSPDEMWAEPSEEQYFRALEQEGLCSCTLLSVAPSLLERIKKKIFGS